MSPLPSASNTYTGSIEGVGADEGRPITPVVIERGRSGGGEGDSSGGIEEEEDDDGDGDIDLEEFKEPGVEPEPAAIEGKSFESPFLEPGVEPIKRDESKTPDGNFETPNFEEDEDEEDSSDERGFESPGLNPPAFETPAGYDAPQYATSNASSLHSEFESAGSLSQPLQLVTIDRGGSTSDLRLVRLSLRCRCQYVRHCRFLTSCPHRPFCRSTSLRP